MPFVSGLLQRGDNGPEVVELQLRLAGFRGTVWDGVFGGGTALQVESFQRDFMGMDAPDGVVGEGTRDAIDRFAETYPIDFGAIRCPCDKCGGFGQGRFSGVYRAGKPPIEAYHHREYPGVHKAILHAFRAAAFYAERAGTLRPILTSGYRCWIHNEMKGRTSTNHMGKALDLDFPTVPGEDKRDDCNRCDRTRGILVEKGDFQIGWGAGNRKALEPSNIAPTWIHMDVRCYEPKYLADEFFVTSPGALDA